MNRPAARYGLLLLGVAGLSMAGVFYKLTSSPIVAVVAWRTLIGFAVMTPLSILLRPPHPRSAFSASDVWWSALAGACFSADLMLWAASLQFTSVASAALFVSTHPIYVAGLAALIYRERPPRAALGGILLGLAGIFLVGVADLRVSGAALTGDALALAAALAETAYILIGRSVRQRVDAPRYVFVVYGACAAFCWLFLAGARISAALSMHDLILAAAVALSATVIGHTLISLSLGYMPAAVVAVSFLAQPALASLFAFVFLHQQIPWTTMVGGAIALAGIGIVAYANERAKAQRSTV